MTPVVIEITFPSSDEANFIAEKLVKSHLIACANILPIRSIYPWKGKVESTDEHVLFAKTDLEKFDQVKAFVEANHSYEVPCIVALSIVDGNKSYLRWLLDSITPPSAPDCAPV